MILTQNMSKYVIIKQNKYIVLFFSSVVPLSFHRPFIIAKTNHQKNDFKGGQ